MRVAVVDFDFAPFSTALATGLAAEAAVLLALPEAEAAVAAAALGATVTVMPFEKPRLRQPLRQTRSMLSLARKLRAWAPDVVHLQGGHLWFNLALPALGGLPLVVEAHDLEHHPGDAASAKTPEWVMNRAFRRADRVVVHAERLRALAVDHGIAPERVDVVPLVAPGVGTAPPVRSSSPTVLFFGRIWPYKGLGTLIEAEPALAERVPGARIVIAGRGENLERYRARMRRPDRYEVIEGWISDQNRDALFARADVVVLPYLEASQSGVVPIAYAHGKPVVCTDVGGLPEVVDHGRTGLVVPPGDPAALADALATVLGDPELRDRMGRAGRAKLEAEMTPGVVARRFAEVYRRALAAKRGVSA